MSGPGAPDRAEDEESFLKRFWGWATLFYGIVLALIAILFVTSKVVEVGSPEAVFNATILVGTGIGGIGTVWMLASAISRGGEPSEVIPLVAQTLGFWAVFLGTLALVLF